MSCSITLWQLRRKGACPSCLERFKRYFGRRISFESKTHAIRVAEYFAAEFDWDWAAFSLLNDKGFRSYLKARRTAEDSYAAGRARAFRVYKHSTKSLKSEYRRAIAPYRAQFDKYEEVPDEYMEAYHKYELATAPMFTKFEKDSAPARIEYEKTLAKTFAFQYWDQCQKGLIAWLLSAQ